VVPLLYSGEVLAQHDFLNDSVLVAGIVAENVTIQPQEENRQQWFVRQSMHF